MTIGNTKVRYTAGKLGFLVRLYCVLVLVWYVEL